MKPTTSQIRNKSSVAGETLSQALEALKTTGGGSLPDWNSITGKPATFPPSAHAHPEKQDTLVSGTNIKTINGQTVLGSGDLVIAGGSGGSGTVTSVAATVPTGFAVSGSPITTSGTITITYSAGYSLPTTAKQGEWDTAYGWGNHATVGYLTVETDPIFSAHVAYGISSTNISNWNTAYTNNHTHSNKTLLDSFVS